MFLIWDFSNPSANSAARIAPWFGFPLCLIAFSNVYARTSSFGISEVTGVFAMVFRGYLGL